MSRELNRTTPLWPLLIIFSIFCVGIRFLFVFFGANLIDEPFFIVMAERFLAGAKPYVDEMNLTQTTALLLAPLVAFLKSIGIGSGIVVSLRLLCFGLQMAVFFSVYKFARRKWVWPCAVTAALPASLFLPSNAAGFTHNSMGGLLFVLGIFLAFNGFSRTPGYRWLPFFAGMVHGACVFAHPVLIFGVATFGISIFLNIDREDRRQFWHYAGGFLLVSIYWVVLYFSTDPTLANDFSDYQLGRNNVWSVRIRAFWAGIRQVLAGGRFVLKLGLAGVGIAFLLLAKKRPRIAQGGLFFIQILLLATLFGKVSNATSYILYYSILVGPVAYILLAKDRTAKRLFYCGWCPGVVGGLFLAFTSNIGFSSFLTAGFSSFVASWLLLLTALHPSRNLWNRFQYASVALLIPVLLTGLARPFLDEPIWKLKSTVLAGPYKYLRTTPDRSRCIANLTDQLAPLFDSKALFYDVNFPALYLLTGTHPAVGSAWGCFAEDSFCLARLKRSTSRGVQVALPKTNPCIDAFRPARSTQGGPIETLVRETCQPTASTDFFQIYRCR